MIDARQIVAAQISLSGNICGKKNSKFLTRGRLITKPEFQRQIAALLIQAKQQWGGRPALTQARINVAFDVATKRGDLDNKLTTVLDVLKDAGVIQNDSMLHVNHIEADCRAVATGAEGAQIWISGYAFAEKQSKTKRVGAA